MTDQSEAATHQTIYNRPARVEAVHSELAKVRWQDNNTRGYVAVEDLAREVA